MRRPEQHSVRRATRPVRGAGTPPQGVDVPLCNLNVTIFDRSLSVTFDMDESQYSQKGMLEWFKASNIYEPEVTFLLFRVLGDGDIFVDVGAHVGYFSVIAAKLVGETGRVLAFEPEPGNLRKLEYHIRINKLANVTVIPHPLSDRAERRPFFINLGNDGGHALWDPATFPSFSGAHQASQPSSVDTTTLDAAWRAAAPDAAPKVIKIDTEGAEKNVLDGSRSLLARHRVPFVVAELHEFGLKQMGASQEDLRDMMSVLGYETFVLPMSEALPKLIPAGVHIESGHFLNILFSRSEWLAPYWPIETVDPYKP